MGRAYPQGVKDAALDAYRQTRSFSAAARSAGASIAAVREWVIKAGLYESKGIGAPLPAAALIDVPAALAGGVSPEAIAAGLRGGDTARWGAVAAALLDSPSLPPPLGEYWRWGEALALAASGAPLEIAEAAGGFEKGAFDDLQSSSFEALQRLGGLLRVAQANAAKALLSQIRSSRGGGGGAAWVLSHQGWDCYKTDHNVNLNLGGLKEMSDEEVIDIVKECLQTAPYHGDEVAPLDEIIGGKTG